MTDVPPKSRLESALTLLGVFALGFGLGAETMTRKVVATMSWGTIELGAHNPMFTNISEIRNFYHALIYAALATAAVGLLGGAILFAYRQRSSGEK